MSKPLDSQLHELQKLGFLSQLDLPQSEKELDKTWGWSAYQGANEVEQELMLVSLDRARVWHRDLKFSERVAPYRKMLLELSEISEGRFQPTLTVWDPNLELVSFECENYRFCYKPASGHYLDSRLLEVVNQSLCGPKRFEVCDGLGMPNVVVFVDQITKQALSSRGWNFLNFQGDWSDGFVSTFFEQGMEEPAWRIFQDARHCDSPTQGWDSAGIERLQDGQELIIWDRHGQQVWSGPLRHRRVRWFRQLSVLDNDWHPPDRSWGDWDQLFVAHPPLRARWRRL